MPSKVIAPSSKGQQTGEATPKGVRVQSDHQSTQRGTCRHYWLIESPDGPQSKGVCQFCGEVRFFHNSWEFSWWERGQIPIPEPEGWDELGDDAPPIPGRLSCSQP